MSIELPLNIAERESGLDDIHRSPKDAGTLELIVRRPTENERECLAEAPLVLSVGLVGENWKSRGSSRMPDRLAHPEVQLTLVNSRVIPPGTRLAIGSAVVEVTVQPHTGCRKFAARFGQDALKSVNSEEGKRLRMRGANARAVGSGVVRVEDSLIKI